MSKINLQREKLTVENRKSREKKRICSEVSVNSPGNPWSQSRRGLVSIILHMTFSTVNHSTNIVQSCSFCFHYTVTTQKSY